MGANNKKKNKNRNKKKNRQNAKQMQHNEQEDQSEHLGEDENLTTPQDEGNFNSSTISSQKRQHNDDDSDHEEDQPRKKKKKKQPVAADPTDKKGKKSIRQMKREKFAERQAEEQSAAKDQLKSQCLNYLSQWKHDKQNWKFMKAKQVWLYKNKFSSSLLPDPSWPLLLEYFESAQGNIRKMLLDDANKVIKQMDEWTESQTEEQPDEEDNEEENNDKDEEAPKSKKPDENVYKRARDLIQCLEE